MKIYKLIFILILSLSFLQVKSQAPAGIIHSDRNGMLYDWKLSNQACYGCGSLFLCVLKDKTTNAKGLYQFYVYLWSNSFYANGLKASTYVTNITIFAVNGNGDKTSILNIPYFVAKPKTDIFNGWNLISTVTGADPQQVMQVTWGGIQAY